MARPDPDGATVLPWTLVAVALVHFALPAYLVTVAVAWFADGTPRDLGFVGRVSAAFLLGYLALTLLAVLLARLLDPPLRRRRARREAGDPAIGQQRSAERVAQAIARAARLANGVDDPLVTAVVRLRRAEWDHGDERDRKLSADLADAVDAFARAHASAMAEGKGEVAALAAASLARIADALDALADERRRLDRGDALTHARYLDARYGSALDSAGSGSG